MRKKRYTIANMTEAVAEFFGSKSVAAICETEVEDIEGWISETGKPNPFAREAIRNLFKITQYMIIYAPPDIVLTWMITDNPWLGNTFPCLIIPRRPDLAFEEAKRFVHATKPRVKSLSDEEKEEKVGDVRV